MKKRQGRRWETMDKSGTDLSALMKHFEVHNRALTEAVLGGMAEARLDHETVLRAIYGGGRTAVLSTLISRRTIIRT